MGSVQNVISHAQKTGSYVFNGAVKVAGGVGKDAYQGASKVVSFTTDLALTIFKFLASYAQKCSGYLVKTAQFTKNNAINLGKFSVSSAKLLTAFASKHPIITLLFGGVSGAAISYGVNYFSNRNVQSEQVQTA